MIGRQQNMRECRETFVGGGGGCRCWWCGPPSYLCKSWTFQTSMSGREVNMKKRFVSVHIQYVFNILLSLSNLVSFAALPYTFQIISSQIFLKVKPNMIICTYGKIHVCRFYFGSEFNYLRLVEELQTLFFLTWLVSYSMIECVCCVLTYTVTIYIIHV